MVKILSVFSRPSSTYLVSPFLPFSPTTFEPARFLTDVLPDSTWLSASSRWAACVLESGPSRSWSTWLFDAGSCRSTALGRPAWSAESACATVNAEQVAVAAARATPIAAALNVQGLLVT